MSQKCATDKLAAPPVLRSGSEPAVVEETPVRASADSAEAFEEERAVMADESDAKTALAEVARLRQELCAKDAADGRRTRASMPVPSLSLLTCLGGQIERPCEL